MKSNFKKEKHKGFNVTTYTFPKYIVPKEVTDSQPMQNYGMLIPQGASVIIKERKYFGWHVLFMKKWVGFKKWRRTVPVRDDMIINFMFWYFVKPLNDERPKFSRTRQG
jgi:hypothetical protein